MENNLQSKWTDIWSPEIHETEHAQKRIKSAQSASLTPVLIDTTDFYGYFQGKHGKYETFLDSCPCGDFRRSKLPCKHIYRLSMELGLLDVTFKSNPNSIPLPKSERVSLDSTIDLVESLSESAQKNLLEIASHINSSNPTYPMAACSTIDELMTSGLLIEPDKKERKINFGKKADMMDLLDSEHIPFYRSARKAELEQICLDNIPEKAREKFGELIYVTIPKEFSFRKIHFYLHRKLDFTGYFYFDSPQIVPLLETELPDDDVTEQLIKRGYYKR